MSTVGLSSGKVGEGAERQTPFFAIRLRETLIYAKLWVGTSVPTLRNQRLCQLYTVATCFNQRFLRRANEKKRFARCSQTAFALMEIRLGPKAMLVSVARQEHRFPGQRGLLPRMPYRTRVLQRSYRDRQQCMSARKYPPDNRKAQQGFPRNTRESPAHSEDTHAATRPIENRARVLSPFSWPNPSLS